MKDFQRTISPSRTIPWSFAILVSLMLWAILIGLVFFTIQIYSKVNEMRISEEETPAFSQRFHRFAPVGEYTRVMPTTMPAGFPGFPYEKTPK